MFRLTLKKQRLLLDEKNYISFNLNKNIEKFMS